MQDLHRFALQPSHILDPKFQVQRKIKFFEVSHSFCFNAVIMTLAGWQTSTDVPLTRKEVPFG